MHESSLIPDLLAKIQQVARDHQADRITAVEVKIGALAGIRADHLREHFLAAAAGTPAEGAELRVTESDDPLDADAGAIRLLTVEVEA